MESVNTGTMKKLRFDWVKINTFLDMSGAERSRETGIPVETWSRLKNTDRFLPPKRIKEIALAFGLTEAEMHVALVMLKQEGENSSSQAA